MAHFAYVRPSGIFNPGIPVDHAEFTSFDQRIFKAINGDDGGTWAPISVITVGGAGITFTGANSSLAPGATLTSFGDLVLAAGSTTELVGISNFGGTANFNGLSVTNFFGGSVTNFFPSSNLVFAAGSTQEFLGTATVSGTTNFDGLSTTNFYGGSQTTFFPSSNLQFEGRLSSTAGLFTLGDSSTLHSTGNFYFGGGGAFVGGVTFAGPSTNFAGAAVRFTSPTELGGHTTLTNDLVITGAGGIAERVVIGADSGTNTYSVSTADVVFVPTITTNTGTYYVDNVGAVDGKRMKFFLPVGGAGGTASFGPHTSIRRTSDGIQLGVLGEMTSTSSCIDLIFIGGAWHYIPGAVHPVVSA
ncbi:MAG: hypothetical protein ABJB12_03860 [Pseudomonadota bacterium]